MFITGPDVVKTVTNEEVGKEELGGAQTHSGKSGVTHFMCDNEEETLMSIRELLSFLPSNNMEDAPLVPCNDDIHRQHPNWILHKELLKACKAKANGHYYVGMPDLMEGLDVLAALKGTDKVLLDTVMQPEVLEQQMQQINDIYFKVFDELYDIIREGDEMAFFQPTKSLQLQGRHLR